MPRNIRRMFGYAAFYIGFTLSAVYVLLQAVRDTSSGIYPEMIPLTPWVGVALMFVGLVALEIKRN